MGGCLGKRGSWLCKTKWLKFCGERRAVHWDINPYSRVWLGCCRRGSLFLMLGLPPGAFFTWRLMAVVWWGSSMSSRWSWTERFLCTFSFPLSSFNSLTSCSPFFHLPAFLALSPFRTLVIFSLCVWHVWPTPFFLLQRSVPGGSDGTIEITNLDFGRTLIIMSS